MMATEMTSLGSMHKVREVFKKFDKNGDGKISKDELKEILEALGSSASNEEVDKMMNEMDKDGDGFVDLQEFAALHALHATSSSDMNEIKDAFEVFDKNGDGIITAYELHVVLKSLHEKCTLKECERMIEGVVGNGKGGVNFQEFKKMMKLDFDNNSN